MDGTIKCKKSLGVITETDRAFVPTSLTPILTKAAVITELKRLLKPRIYYLKIWEPYGAKITAKWKSDVSIDIYTEAEIITKKRTKYIYTMEQILEDLELFKTEIDCLCKSSDILALAKKRKNKINGHLTENESIEYFQELQYEVEK